MVIDREVEVLPACMRATREPVAVDAFPDGPEATEPLDVDMDQFAGLLAFVAANWLTDRLPQP
ncbi:MAG: hypothetical protein R3C15_23820 [Thermoleophilia bacterium]